MHKGIPLENDKVITKKESIIRCDWCGTYYSPSWVQPHPPDGRKFCSDECMSGSIAGTLDSEVIHSDAALIFCGILLTLICIAIIIIAGNAGIAIDIEPLFYLLILSLSCIFSGIGKRRSIKEGQKYLYRKDMYRDSYEILLECEFCSHLNPPDVLDCQHCNGSLRDARKKEGEIPEWLKEDITVRQSRRKCIHCEAVYTYRKFNEDGTVTCQNCGKQFPFSQR